MKKFPCGLRRSWLLSSALRAEISSPAGEICSRLCREISSLCERVNFFSSGKEISPGFFRIRGFIYPGSYLLSRDLSSDYHRRADVSLPGSEWIRVGPSGYDHQASAVLCTPGSSLLRTSHFVLRTSVCLVVFCFLPGSVVAAAVFAGWQTGIRVAFRDFFFFHFVLCALSLALLSESCRNCLSPGVTFLLYKVCWMLVVLGSIHCCNYTCTLSTWSSSTLL